MPRNNIPRDEITIGFLHECFSLDAEAGELVWKVRPDSHFLSAADAARLNGLMAGKVAGWIRKGEDRKVTKIAGHNHFCHRLIYAMANEVDLKDVPPILDHVDGNSLNNRPINLRAADKFENAFNAGRYSHNTSGHKGVYFDKREGGWVARIMAFKVSTYLGIYRTKEEAGAAYCGAARVLHGEFFRENQDPVEAAA